MPVKDLKGKSWLQIGLVGHPHGLNGAFYLSTRESSSLQDSTLSGDLLIGHSLEQSKNFALTKQTNSANKTKKIIFKFAQINSRTEAEILKGQKIWVARDDLKIDDAKEYLWVDLIGLKVVCLDGTCLGTVGKIFNFGASDIVEIIGDNQKSLELPLVSLYFDMSFNKTSTQLSMIVPAETFDEFWT